MFSWRNSVAFLVLCPLSIAALTSGPSFPTPVACPSSGTLVRSAGTGPAQLSPGENSYISTRASTVLPGAWNTYLKNVLSTSPTPNQAQAGIHNILTSQSARLPKLGIAVSGGSYRAALFGAGVLSSLDARNSTAAQKTGTGGLLQAASYLSGISGGSWLVTSLAQANFPTIADLTFPPAAQLNSGLGNAAFGGWLAQFDLTNPGPTANDTLAYVEAILAEIAPKFAAGFPVTITDVWGKAITRHFVNGTTPQDILAEGAHGAGILFSDIAKVPSFVAHEQPFPILIADSIPPRPNASETVPGETVPLTSELWEFNVFESGSFDPMLASFVPTSLLGSVNASKCVAGFDQAGYIAGISSDLFNEFNVSAAALLASPAGPIIELINATFGPQEVRLDSAAVPNPFKGINPNTFANTNEDFVTLVDGGSDGEQIPIQPLLVGARAVDTIIAIDASADTADNFANGTDFINSAKRAALFGSLYPFPTIPSTADIFVQQNLTRHPTFFGCNDSVETPMIIYIANGGPPADGAAPVTGTPRLQTTYTPEEVRAFIDQAFDIATQGIDGDASDWGTCLACGVVEKARARAGVPRLSVCSACLERYCWNG
ncbi:lysophospholipase [Gautieria morchelliformis]|nr:lysophospholipase [Gautieria morchelliformis]